MVDVFTSESVTEGHPDKVADQISDGVLDAMLAVDENSRVACECMLGHGMVLVSGEVTSKGYVDIPGVVRKVIKTVGYDDSRKGLDYQSCGVITALQKQSPDIAQGVDKGGAGDQGMMFGYACRETAELMPMPIAIAHKLSRRLAKIRKTKVVSFLRPDGKSQVTVRYQDGKPKNISSVLVSAQHEPEVKQKELKEAIYEEVVKQVIPPHLMAKDTVFLCNPTGRFEKGGPAADTGLTGRKIIVDTYGGMGRHGGGAFSGKDPSKVDRSASYMARYIAKNCVAAGLAERIEVQLSYAIGIAEPTSVFVDTFGTGNLTNEEIIEKIRINFDMTPAAIISNLKLRRPIYTKSAAYGHFGREEKEFTWERTDKMAALRS